MSRAVFDLDDLQKTIALANEEVAKQKVEHAALMAKANTLKTAIDATEAWVKITGGLIELNRAKINVSALSGTKVLG